MHVVLIKNTVGHAARRVLDVTKKKSQDRFARGVLCLFLQQPQPTTIVSKFYYRNPIITRRMLAAFYSMYQACKNLFWILAPGKMDAMQTVFHLKVHLSSFNEVCLHIQKILIKMDSWFYFQMKCRVLFILYKQFHMACHKNEIFYEVLRAPTKKNLFHFGHCSNSTYQGRSLPAASKQNFTTLQSREPHYFIG